MPGRDGPELPGWDVSDPRYRRAVGDAPWVGKLERVWPEVDVAEAHDSDGVQLGRKPVTSRAELEAVALRIFLLQGFDVTSVDEIAAAAGISRRTFFRYFKSKNDCVWGDFDTQLLAFAAWFDACPLETPLAEAIRTGVVAFNSFDGDAVTGLRDRMQVILSSPALQAYSTLRYREWRAVVARFAAGRLGLTELDLTSRTIGHLALGAALAGYEVWLESEDMDLAPILERALSGLEGLAAMEHR